MLKLVYVVFLIYITETPIEKIEKTKILYIRFTVKWVINLKYFSVTSIIWGLIILLFEVIWICTDGLTKQKDSFSNIVEDVIVIE